MPTDNPKISAYVPQLIYDRFKQFQDETQLSMSQATIVILAEYFGLKQTIRETTEGITVGGVTLERVQLIESRLTELEKLLSRSQSTVESVSEPQKPGSLQYSLLGEPELILNNNETMYTSQQLANRLSSPKKTITTQSVTNQVRKSSKEFYDWSKSCDPDDIPWKKVSEEKPLKFCPAISLTPETLAKL
jgi:hypothetical protein